MKHLTNILFAFMLTLCITAFAVGQVVTTDKPDYEPGEMMLITGNDFAADEQIRVRILDLDRNTIVHEQMVQADGFGGFSLSWQNPPLLDPNDVLYHAAAEAIGTSSNLSAIAYFTDGVPTRLSSPAPGPSSGVCGATITVYATLQYKPGSPGSWGDWAPLPGKTINFTLGSSSGSGITNANGYATAQLVVPEGATLLVASFAGDGAYNPVDLQNISFTVTGTCATAPTITCPSDITVNNATGLCGAIVTFTTPATATGTPTPTISYSPISGLFFPVGTTQVTATATNSAGSDQCTFNVTVNDNEAPIPQVASLPDVTGECSVNLIAPTATDNCAGTITGTTDKMVFDEQGTFVVTWTYNDGHGNTTTQTQNVVVKDVAAPVPNIATLPNATGECSVTLTVPTATDNCAGTITGTTTDPTTYDAQGEYTVTWTYDDGNGNTISQTQNVIVKDITAPVPNVATLADVIAQCSVNLPAAPTATDNCAGTVTGVADVTGPFGQGNHTIMWTYSDGNGNNSTQMQWVRVHDTQAPVVTAPGAKVFPICGPFDLGSASALDNCDGALTPTNNAPPSFPLGNTAVTWSATDAAGNTGTAAQNVTVNYGSVEGFLPPMAPYPTAINIKKGRTVPVKFRLTQCPGVSNVIANISVDEASGMSSDVIAPLDVVGTSAADVGTLFRYSASDDQYIFNLSTNNMVVGKTYRIRATLADGQIIYGFVRVTK